MLFYIIAGLLLMCQTAQAWEIRIHGDGETPEVTIIDGGVKPPAEPLPPPPVVVPPVVDSSPFTFPVAQPPQNNSGEARFYNLCPRDCGCYSGLPEYDNPLRLSHLFACYLPMGMRFGPASLGGYRLYVCKDLDPSKIRLLCAGGVVQ